MPTFAIGTPEPSLAIALLSLVGAGVPLIIRFVDLLKDKRSDRRAERGLAGQLEDQLLDNAREAVGMANQQTDRERERANRAEAKSDALEMRVVQLEQTIKEQAGHITLMERENQALKDRLARLEARTP